jgi:hypothetical protein
MTPLPRPDMTPPLTKINFDPFFGTECTFDFRGSPFYSFLAYLSYLNIKKTY